MTHIIVTLMFACSSLAANAQQDTTFQTEHVRTMQEVLVRADEPAWIRQKLRTFIRQREANYQREESFLDFDYQIRTTLGQNDSTYRFTSRGMLYAPSMAQLRRDSVFQMAPERNIVYGRDTTLVHHPDSAPVTWAHLDEMLYQNLILTLDNRFLRQHRFAVNHQFQSSDPNVIQLIYWSRKYDLDRGFLNLDTARCVVLEAERHSGLDCVRSEFCSAFALWVTHLLVKRELKEWSINLRAVYTTDGQPSEFRYQSRRRLAMWSELSRKRRQWLDNTRTDEASLRLRPTTRRPIPADLIDIISGKAIQIERSGGRRDMMRRRMGAVKREYVILTQETKKKPAQ